MDTIRHARLADAEALAAIYAPAVRDAATSFELVPPTAAELAARVAAIQAWAPWLVLERAGQVVGYAYAARHRDRPAYQWSVDVSVYVADAAQRTGVGRALYDRLLPMLRDQGFCVAHAGITLPNPASVRLHEACGFTPVGVYPAVGWKLGAWHDVGWWRRPLRPPDPTVAPAPPGPPAAAIPPG